MPLWSPFPIRLPELPTASGVQGILASIVPLLTRVLDLPAACKSSFKAYILSFQEVMATPLDQWMGSTLTPYLNPLRLPLLCQHWELIQRTQCPAMMINVRISSHDSTRASYVIKRLLRNNYSHDFRVFIHITPWRVSKSNVHKPQPPVIPSPSDSLLEPSS